MKITFLATEKPRWGELQAKVSEQIIRHLSADKDFLVSFSTDKTVPQLRGFHRICDVLSPFLAESEGTFFDKEMVKELVKQECNYCSVVKGRLITKSLSHATREQMRTMIEKLYELGYFYKATNYKLTSTEKQALIDYYSGEKDN